MHFHHNPAPDEWGLFPDKAVRSRRKRPTPPKLTLVLLFLFAISLIALLVAALAIRIPFMMRSRDTGITHIQDEQAVLHFSVYAQQPVRGGGVVAANGQIWLASSVDVQSNMTELLIPLASEPNTSISTIKAYPFYWTDQTIFVGAVIDLMPVHRADGPHDGVAITQTPLDNGQVLVQLMYEFNGLDTNHVYATGFMLALGAGEQYAVGEPEIVSASAKHSLSVHKKLENGDYVCTPYAFSLTGAGSQFGQQQRFTVRWSTPLATPMQNSSASTQPQTEKPLTSGLPDGNQSATPLPTVLPAATSAVPSAGRATLQPNNIVKPASPLFSLYDVSTRFYYPQLTDKQKALFAELYDGLADFNTTVTPKGNYSPTDLQPVLDVLRFDCPELIFLNRQDTTYRTGPDRLVDATFTFVMQPREFEGELSRMMDEIKAISAFPGFGNDTYGKELVIYRELIRRNTYQMNQPFGSECNSVWLRGYGECDGFTRGLNLALRYYGIPCGEVVGKTYDSGVISPVAHMWSYVNLDDVWYQCDITWDNGLSKTVGDQALANQCLPYFNINDAMMMSARTRSTESLTNWHWPACDSLKDNYYNREGLRIPPSADIQEILNDRLTQAYLNKSNGVVLPFSNSADISTALVRLPKAIGQWRYQGTQLAQYQYFYQFDCNFLCISALQYH